jgi:two-component system nitrogen regulation response regulator GlnG
VARVMNTDLPVLVTGESGTGKSLIARALHDFSDRRNLPFVTVTAAELTELDGPAKVMARVRGGTLLIDEIADINEEVQGRIVRMMDVLGDHSPRFIAASQYAPHALIEEGLVRKDLFYRLDGAAIEVPSLRERVEDIPLLAEHFLTRALRDGAPHRRLSAGAEELFRLYSWPGNVRQLEHAVRRLGLTSRAEDITRSEVEAVLGNQPDTGPVLRGGEADKLGDSVARHLRRYFDLHGALLPPPGLYARILKEVEIPLIEIALEATGGNQAKCADLLGINRNTLRKKITDLDIRVTRRRKLM